MGLLSIIHVLVCILLISVVLLQVGRGASAGASFGGGVKTFFGPAGAVSFLGRAIIVLAVIFVVMTLFLSVFSPEAKPPEIKVGTETSAVRINLA